MAAPSTVEGDECREIVARPQHERLVPALAIETHHTIEYDIELRYPDRCGRFVAAATRSLGPHTGVARRMQVT